jgi:hypothetical protein
MFSLLFDVDQNSTYDSHNHYSHEPRQGSVKRERER